MRSDGSTVLSLSSHVLLGGGSPMTGTSYSNVWPARTLISARKLRSILGATTHKTTNKYIIYILFENKI